MTLEHVRITPPFEWKEGSNTLQFLWSVENAAAWWAMRIGGVGGRPLDISGGDRAAWWAETGPMIVSRRRSVLADFEGGQG